MTSSSPIGLRRFGAAAALLAACGASPAAAQADTSFVASFDTAWTTVQRTHFDTAYNGVDWDAVRRELRPRALAARNPAELRTVLRDMLARLGQSHFYLIPRETQQVLTAGGGAPSAGDAGLDVRLVEEEIVVTAVRPGSAAHRAGIRPGWVVERAGTHEMGALLLALRGLDTADPRAAQLQAWSAVRAALAGAAGDTLRLRLRDGADRTRQIALARDAAPGEPTRFGNLPEMRVKVDSARVRAGTATVGVIAFNLWLPALAPALDETVHAFRGTDGMVLDLRGNVGGAGAMAMGVAGHFVDRPDTLGTMRMRTATLRFVINPRRTTARGERVAPFAGPVAILTDATTASTSEIFAGGMQRLGRARVFGAPSAGQALPAYMKRLPSGDVLVHAIADFTGPAGARMEGAGVVPDVAAAPTRAALLAGEDPAMDAALAWIASQKHP